MVYMSKTLKCKGMLHPVCVSVCGCGFLPQSREDAKFKFLCASAPPR
jgi:hypothetical protein